MLITKSLSDLISSRSDQEPEVKSEILGLRSVPACKDSVVQLGCISFLNTFHASKIGRVWSAVCKEVGKAMHDLSGAV